MMSSIPSEITIINEIAKSLQEDGIENEHQIRQLTKAVSALSDLRKWGKDCQNKVRGLLEARNGGNPWRRWLTEASHLNHSLLRSLDARLTNLRDLETRVLKMHSTCKTLIRNKFGTHVARIINEFLMVNRKRGSCFFLLVFHIFSVIKG